MTTKRIIEFTLIIFFYFIISSTSIFATNDDKFVDISDTTNINQYLNIPDTDITISIDKNTGNTEGMSFSEFFGDEVTTEANNNGIEDAIKNTEYEIINETKNEFICESPFKSKQLLINGRITDVYDSINSYYYEDKTILVFQDELSTKNAYYNLINEYGKENVLIDIPMEANTYDWGKECMNFPSENKRIIESNNKNKITVAVIDSGINKNHVAFNNTRFSAFNKSFINNSSPFYDGIGHGTSVASIIAMSTPPNVEIMSIKLFDKNTAYGLITVMLAAEYAANNGANIINMSLGTEKALSKFIKEYVDNSLNDLAKSNIVIVSSSGNSGKYEPEYPAANENTISVSSINTTGEISSFSTYHDSVDFCAPGKSVYVANNRSNTSFGYSSGTSFSAPYISAACALIKIKDPTLTNSAVKNKLIQMSVDKGIPGKDIYYGYGLPVFHVYEKKLTANMISISNPTYNGKIRTPKITIKNNGKIINSYRVKYLGNRKKIGTYKVIITGISPYVGRVIKTYKIIPKTPKLKVKKLKNKRKIYWNKTGTFYQIKAKKTWNSTAKIYKIKKRSKIFKKNKYIQIRAGYKSKGKIFYSSWSEWKRLY